MKIVIIGLALVLAISLRLWQRFLIFALEPIQMSQGLCLYDLVMGDLGTMDGRDLLA